MYRNGSFARRIYTLSLNTALWFSSLHIIKGLFVLQHISFRAQMSPKYQICFQSKTDSAFHNEKKWIQFQNISDVLAVRCNDVLYHVKNNNKYFLFHFCQIVAIEIVMVGLSLVSQSAVIESYTSDPM